MPWTKYFASLLIWRQNHLKLSQINMILRKETLKKDCMSWVKKQTNIELMSQAQRIHFLQDTF